MGYGVAAFDQLVSPLLCLVILLLLRFFLSCSSFSCSYLSYCYAVYSDRSVFYLFSSSFLLLGVLVLLFSCLCELVAM